MKSKIALITDQHFQARKTSKHFHTYFLHFYSRVFFPYLERHNIKTVIDLGDTFDNRNFLDPAAIDWAKENYYNVLHAMGIDHHIIVGNHTSKLKNTNRISSVDLILREYENITVYKDPTEVKIKGLDILFVPWINRENQTQTYTMIKDTKARVVMGHLELNGFSPYRGHIMQDGIDPSSFQKFEKVFSGHYHTRSDNGKIFYIGNPYELYFNDVNDDRGFVIFDTETLEHEYVNNPYKLHYQIYYDGEKEYDDPEYLREKIVKVIVRKIDDFKHFEDFINQINAVQPLELKIIEPTYEAKVEEFETFESEDTLSLLNRFIDEAEISQDKGRIKNIVNNIYREVLQNV